jgi:hypothetical protein
MTGTPDENLRLHPDGQGGHAAAVSRPDLARKRKKFLSIANQMKIRRTKDVETLISQRHSTGESLHNPSLGCLPRRQEKVAQVVPLGGVARSPRR